MRARLIAPPTHTPPMSPSTQSARRDRNAPQPPTLTPTLKSLPVIAIILDDMPLHIDCENALRDLFDVAQPPARLEDLVRIVGAKRKKSRASRACSEATKIDPKYQINGKTARHRMRLGQHRA